MISKSWSMDSQLSKTVSTVLIRPLEVSKSYFKCNPQNGPGGALFLGMSPHGKFVFSKIIWKTTKLLFESLLVMFLCFCYCFGWCCLFLLLFLVKSYGKLLNFFLKVCWLCFWIEWHFLISFFFYKPISQDGWWCRH